MWSPVAYSCIHDSEGNSFVSTLNLLFFLSESECNQFIFKIADVGSKNIPCLYFDWFGISSLTPGHFVMPVITLLLRLLVMTFALSYFRSQTGFF